MSGLDTALSGDPDGCAAAARLLQRRAATLEATTDVLARHAGLEGDLAGVTGDAYRARAHTLVGDSAALAGHHRAIATALARFADRLARVADQLAQCRAVAHRSLVLRGDLVVKPGPYATAAQHTLYQQLAQRVAAARADEDGAHFAWQSALAEHADTPSPSPPWHGSPTGPLPPPPLTDVPPVEAPRETVSSAAPPPAEVPGRHEPPGPRVGPGVGPDPPTEPSTTPPTPDTPPDTPPDVAASVAPAPVRHHVLIGPEAQHVVWHPPGPAPDR